jgi:ElaB/YqjD/DUF883 family membrane-anchored ribosome-binding protein
MADEIRVQRDDETLGSRPAVRPAITDPERQLPAEAGAATDFDDPEEARAHIEATRARMSGTIDEIEGVLVRKKEEIQNRLDFVAPIRENPWQSMGIALGAGLILGLLTGGSDDEDEDDEYDYDGEYDSYSRSSGYGTRFRGETVGYRSRGDLEHRTEVLEERTRRLLAIARDQEDELRRVRGKKKKSGKSALGKRVSRGLEEGYDDAADYAQEAASRLDGVSGMVAEAVVGFLRDAVRQMIGRR